MLKLIILTAFMTQNRFITTKEIHVNAKFMSKTHLNVGPWILGTSEIHNSILYFLQINDFFYQSWILLVPFEDVLLMFLLKGAPNIIHQDEFARCEELYNTVSYISHNASC